MEKLELDLTAKGSKKKILKSLKLAVKWFEKDVEPDTIKHYYCCGNKFRAEVNRHKKK